MKCPVTNTVSSGETAMDMASTLAERPTLVELTTCAPVNHTSPPPLPLATALPAQASEPAATTAATAALSVFHRGVLGRDGFRRMGKRFPVGAPGRRSATPNSRKMCTHGHTSCLFDRVADDNGPVLGKSSFRVVLLEDDSFTLMTLAALVASSGHEVVDRASTIVQAIDCARREPLDVAIVDLDLGVGPTGIDAAHGLRAVAANIGIVILSSYAEPRLMGRRARPLPIGAQFLSKQELGDSATLDRAMQAAVDFDETASPGAPVSGLTDTQIEIMRLVASGLSNDDIAARLWLTESGVKRAITRLLRKLGLEGGNARVHLTRAYAQLAGRSVGDG